MTELVRYDEMCRAIDACYTVDEVKDIRDKALAIEEYMRRAKNPEPERRACEIRLRAERKAGQILKDMEKAPGARGNPGGQGAPIVRSPDATTQTLSDMGISKDQSAYWQKLADVPEDEFEAVLAAPEKPSTTGIIRASEESSNVPGPMDPKALWLWGRLRDFERDGLLNEDPRSILSQMTNAMRADVHRLVRPVTQWLEGAINE